jgi:hypothetical protein
MDINRKLRQIQQTVRGLGTRPAVIDAVDMLCDIIKELADVHVYVSDVPNKIEDLPTDPEVPKSEVSKPPGNKAGKAKKGTTGKAKTTTKL